MRDKPRMVGCSGKADVARGQPAFGWHHDITRGEVLAGAPDVAAGATASLTRTSGPAAAASSCSRIASAPLGTTLPVNSRTAWPGPIAASKRMASRGSCR